MAGLEQAHAISNAVGNAQNPTEVLYIVALHFVDQFLDFLETAVTTDELLSRQSQLSPGSTVGKHARHLLDHYRLLLQGVSDADSPASAASSVATAFPSSTRAPPPIHVNYDLRTRNLAAETSHSACVESFEQLRAQLRHVTAQGRGVDAERVVRLHATTPVQVEVGSTFARELWFASFHAVHHFALIRVIATGELGVTVPKDFGVAPATLVHRQEEASKL
ncbi:uncharacterized protein JCM10292_004106 [Rhodotorula paludigena]|uniref:uncharacterized protein n=1 Tax=Rhodotorula paludigena TaxID=86838 RepID=UPI00316FB36A